MINIKKFTKLWPLLTIILLSFWLIKPFFYSGFFSMHDDTQVVRVQQMAQALRDGQFPVRWVPHLGYGYGYPLFNFYAPLAYYFGGFLNLVGFDALLSTKLMMITGLLLSGVFMYFFAREFWGKLGGILAALFYLYAPYHALDVYVRGAVAEFWAMAFLPLLFLGLYRLYQSRGVIIATLGFAMLILSHNLTTMMVVPFLLILSFIGLIFVENKKKFLQDNLLFLVFSLGLSAFYWLPALFEMEYTRILGQIGGGADFHDHFVFLDQLWNSPWGFGGSSPGRLDGMSFMIGKLHLVAVFFTLLIGFLLWPRKKHLSFLIFFSFFLLMVAIFFTNQLSLPIWEAASVMAFIQYPWRFLALSTFISSFMVGAIAWWLKKNSHQPFLFVILILLVLLLFNVKYFQPQTLLQVKSQDYVNQENIKWTTSKISDEYLPSGFPIPNNKNEIPLEKLTVLKGQAEIKNLIVKTQEYRFTAKVSQAAEILVNTAYFIGWQAEDNGQELKIFSDNGKIKLTLPVGDHQIIVRFINTPLRTLANLLSLFSFLALGWVILHRKQTN